MLIENYKFSMDSISCLKVYSFSYNKPESLDHNFIHCNFMKFNDSKLIIENHGNYQVLLMCGCDLKSNNIFLLGTRQSEFLKACFLHDLRYIATIPVGCPLSVL